jgi:hypothetical protein
VILKSRIVEEFKTNSHYFRLHVINEVLFFDPSYYSQLNHGGWITDGRLSLCSYRIRNLTAKSLTLHAYKTRQCVSFLHCYRIYVYVETVSV